ncbi:MAG TPA: ATP-binding protein [Chthonomonadaceae bacterium]|nr:ATP-binding protein [Chthonomonadaceae bacterium]
MRRPAASHESLPESAHADRRASFHDWQERNKGALVVAMSRIRERLEAFAEGRAPTPAAGEIEEGTTLAALRRAFRMDPFELDLLLLCAGIELDGRFAALCASIHKNASQNYPTFSLALKCLNEPRWSALTPAAALRRYRLLHVIGEDGAAPLTVCPLRIDEWTLHYLTGALYPDPSLPGKMLPFHAADPVVPDPGLALRKFAAAHGVQSKMHYEAAMEIASTWKAIAARGEVLPVIQLCGDAQADKVEVAWMAARDADLRLRVVALPELPLRAADQERMLALREREASLMPTALLIEIESPSEPADAEKSDPGSAPLAGADGQRYRGLLERVAGPVFIACDKRLPSTRPALLRDVNKPDAAEQQALWEIALRASGLPRETWCAWEAAAAIPEVTAQFHLSAGQITSAAREVVATLEIQPGGGAERCWEVCRRQARTDLESLGQRIESSAGWEDLILPASHVDLLRSIAAQVRNRARVYQEWGFQGRGLGITALFSGASGTGKTLAAEAIANELRLDLFRVDLAGVVSKYIGETEKNLRRLFAAAESGGAILLFDEADSLFGKRSEVKDSHDRHANIEVAYLLQRMENYRGLAILTTNLKSALDVAFYRRIRFVLEFPFPDKALREGIWRRAFPGRVPTYALDMERLAQLNFAGGSIRNCALNAAFLAAEHGGAVRMSHVLRAARAECAKMERRLADAEIEGWDLDVTAPLLPVETPPSLAAGSISSE